MPNIFPREFIESSIEHYTFKLRRGTVSIYTILIMAILLFIVSLPFIRINVATSVVGFIGTKENRYDLNTSVGSFILHNGLEKGKQVSAGDTLLVIDNEVLQKELSQVNSRLFEVTRFLADLQALITDKDPTYELYTTRFQIAFAKYNTELSKFQLEVDNYQAIYNRQKILHDAGAIADVEFEKDKASLQKARLNIALFKRQATNMWKENSLDLAQEKEQLLFRKKEIENELSKFIITAPNNGELQNVQTLNVNQFVPMGFKVAEITPSTQPLAICWVSPKEIGLLHHDMTGSFQVDAYNPNEWGYLTGNITEISSDTYIEWKTNPFSGSNAN